MISVSDFFESTTKPEGACEPVPNQLYSLKLEPDLKDVCRRTHMRLSGRKTEVLARIERGWHIDSPGVRDAVRIAINPCSFSSRGSGANSNAMSYGGTSGSSNSSNSSSTHGGYSLKITVPLPKNGGGSNVRCVCNSQHMLPAMVKCCECGALLHPTCVHVPDHEASTPSFACALCKAAWLDPFIPMLVGQEQVDRLGCRTEGPLAASLDPLLAAFRQQFYVPGASQMQLSNAVQPNVTHMDVELSSARLHDLLLGKKLEVPHAHAQYVPRPRAHVPRPTCSPCPGPPPPSLPITSRLALDFRCAYSSPTPPTVSATTAGRSAPPCTSTASPPLASSSAHR